MATGSTEVIEFRPHKFVLTTHEPQGLNPDSDELARLVLARIGLAPRKAGATDKMHHALLELYEKSKRAHRKKRPELAVMTVEEMAMCAGIARQTMYDYLGRWTAMRIIEKMSFIADNKVVIGYRLSGNTIEQAFEKATRILQQNLDLTQKYIRELQRQIKNEKIALAAQQNVQNNGSPQQEVVAEA